MAAKKKTGKQNLKGSVSTAPLMVLPPEPVLDPSKTVYGSTHHYCLAQNPDKLWAWANMIGLKRLRELLKPDEYPVFCYSGASGIATATALSVVYHLKVGPKFGMIYVRKKDEESHGRDAECMFSNIGKHPILVLVDDCVSSGRTRKHVISGAQSDRVNERLPDSIVLNGDEFIQILTDHAEPGYYNKGSDRIKMEVALAPNY